MIDSIVLKMRNNYLRTALWSSVDFDDETPYDEKYDIADFTFEAQCAAYDDCAKFLDIIHGGGD